MSMRLHHHVYERAEAESIVKDAFRDHPADSSRFSNGAGEEPSGVRLTDDPVLSYEHHGAEILRIDVDATDGDLLQLEDLKRQVNNGN
jgi:hypothetical protein